MDDVCEGIENVWKNVTVARDVVKFVSFVFRCR